MGVERMVLLTIGCRLVIISIIICVYLENSFCEVPTEASAWNYECGELVAYARRVLHATMVLGVCCIVWHWTNAKLLSVGLRSPCQNKRM